jgi:hypothetical protein
LFVVEVEVEVLQQELLHLEVVLVELELELEQLEPQTLEVAEVVAELLVLQEAEEVVQD